MTSHPAAMTARRSTRIALPMDEQASVADLIRTKRKVLVPMILIYMVGYVGLTVLASFDRGFIAQKVAGSLNVGFLLIACNYVISWLLALVYVRIANDRWDPMVERAIKTAGAKGRKS